MDAGSSDLKPAAKKIKLESDSRQRAFHEVWLSQFDWLEYKSDSKRMFCRICFQKELISNGQSISYKGIKLTHSNEKNCIDKMKKDYIKAVCQHIGSRISSE